jgi:hypothetical protein
MLIDRIRHKNMPRAPDMRVKSLKYLGLKLAPAIATVNIPR